MNIKTKLAFTVSTLSAIALSSSLYALEAKIHVKTVNQVSVSEKQTMNLGEIAGSQGYECEIPQRLDIVFDSVSVADTTTATLTESTSFTGIELCGTTQTPGFFEFVGIADQNVNVAFEEDAANALVGSFTAEGVYQNIDWNPGSPGFDISGTYSYTDAGSTETDAEQEANSQALIDADFVTIYNTGGVVKLNSNGKGIIKVGGRIKITEVLEADTTYNMGYTVNVTYQ